MIVPIKILETEDVIFFLKRRNLLKQYKKSKEIILKGLFGKTKFGEKMPKGINKQFRAIGSLDKNKVLKIFEIDNHQ